MCLIVKLTMKLSNQRNQHKEIPKLKPFNYTITMTFILSRIFNLFLFQRSGGRGGGASQQTKYNPIHCATLSIEEKNLWEAL